MYPSNDILHGDSTRVLKQLPSVPEAPSRACPPYLDMALDDVGKKH